MKFAKKLMVCILALCLLLCVFAGCSTQGADSSAAQESSQAPQPEESAQSEESAGPAQNAEGVKVRVGTLKGPTGMGMVGLMQFAEEGDTSNEYEFSLKGAPEDVRAMLISGEVDIAALPTNMAAVLYNQDQGSVQILAANTLGVLYVLEKGEPVASVADLAGKTLYITGQGAAPEYVMGYILKKNGLDPASDVSMEYLSEHAELATKMVAGEVSLGMLPEPFVTTTIFKDDSIKVALDITKEWNNVSFGTALVMGCIVVRTEFAEENPDAVAAFLSEYEESVNFVNRDIADAAQLMGKFEIIAQEVAEKSIPNCNIVYMDGDNMKSSVESFLNVLYEANPQSIGGSLPDEAFYYQKHR